MGLLERDLFGFFLMIYFKKNLIQLLTGSRFLT